MLLGMWDIAYFFLLRRDSAIFWTPISEVLLSQRLSQRSNCGGRKLSPVFIYRADILKSYVKIVSLKLRLVCVCLGVGVCGGQGRGGGSGGLIFNVIEKNILLYKVLLIVQMLRYPYSEQKRRNVRAPTFCCRICRPSEDSEACAKFLHANKEH